MALPTAEQRARHVELILSRIDALPTLSPVAVRVMKAVGSDDADLSEVTRLIESDPALSARILALTRRSDLGLARGITSVSRIIVLLGIDALRAALLSAELYEMFKPASPGSERAGDEPDADDDEVAFDATGFWRHSIAVACAAELIAEKARAALPGVKPGEAYLCGLLHDLGKPALERALPRTYARVLSLAADGRADLATVEKRVMGLDHHAAGKRLAERWGLPHCVTDAMWLHARSVHAMPELPHRLTVALVGLADTLCRGLHLGFSGNAEGLDRLSSRCEQVGLELDAVRAVEPALITRVAERCEALGLEKATDRDLLLDALAQANRTLALIGQRTAAAAAAAPAPALTANDPAARTLAAVEAFQSSLASARGVDDAVARVGSSVLKWLGGQSVALLWQHRAGAPWEGYEFGATPNAEANLRQRHAFDALPPTSPETTWTINTPDASGALVVLHDREGARPPAALAQAWLGAVRAAASHQGAVRLSEQLVETTDRLAKAEEAAARSRLMSSLGEITAGAAHEMNNPLAVIGGNAQLLARKITNPADSRSVLAIVKAAARLGDLVQSLHLFASPPEPKRVQADLNEVIALACRDARERCGMPSGHGSRNGDPALSVRAGVEPQARFALVDAPQLRRCVSELLANAMEASAKSLIEVRVSVDPLDGRLLIAVRDDGKGMSQKDLEHACDPFFSAKPAGRSTGMGLAKARQIAQLHGGTLTLVSEPDKGTTATVAILNWRSLPVERPAAERTIAA